MPSLPINAAQRPQKRWRPVSGRHVNWLLRHHEWQVSVFYLGLWNGRRNNAHRSPYNLHHKAFENVSCASPNMSFEHTRWKGLFSVFRRNRSTRDIFIGTKPATYWRPGPLNFLHAPSTLKNVGLSQRSQIRLCHLTHSVSRQCINNSEGFGNLVGRHFSGTPFF